MPLSRSAHDLGVYFRQYIARRLLRLIVLCFPWYCVPATAQRHVEITARLETLSYRLEDLQDGKSPIHRSYSVTCISGVNDWRIDAPGKNGRQNWLFDGTNLYLNIMASNSVPKLNEGKPAYSGSNSLQSSPQAPAAAGVVSSVHVFESHDGCPLDMQSVNISWLAFCSGSYLKRAGRLIPLPVVDLRHSPDGFAYADKTETFEDEMGLPKSIDLLSSDVLFEASVKSDVFEGKHDVELWKRGAMGFKWDLPDGTLRFHYAVTETTNFSGWNIPVKFEWFMYFYKGGSAKQVPLGTGIVTSIRAAEKPESVVDASLHPTIVDWRFRDLNKGVQAIVYGSTNKSASPTNDPELQARFAAGLKAAPPKRK